MKYCRPLHDISYFQTVSRPPGAGPRGAVGSQSQRSRVRYPFRPLTLVSPSADSRGAVANNWQMYLHEVLVNRSESQSLPRKSVVRLIDRPDMTIDVYSGRKTTTQQVDRPNVECVTAFSLLHLDPSGTRGLLYGCMTLCRKCCSSKALSFP